MSEQTEFNINEFKPDWVSHDKYYTDALKYIIGRKEGRIKSFKTPWPKINDAGIDGFEWNSFILVGARPGGGKTLFEQQLIREGFTINPGQGIRALNYQFEMLGRNSKIREFSSVSKHTYKYLCSAEEEGVTVTDELIKKLTEYARSAAKFPIDIVSKPITVAQFRQSVINYFEYHRIKSGTNTYPHTVVTVDHSVLFKRDKGQSRHDSLNDLGEVITELKKLFPVIFIVLSQLGREIESSARCENGKHGNYPNSNDIFGADALTQHADIIALLDRPALRHITRYGPHRFIISDDTILAIHTTKTRTGDTRISFFKANFQNMSIDNASTPPQDKRIANKKDVEELANQLILSDEQIDQLEKDLNNEPGHK